MLEKFISFVTAFVINVISFFQAPAKPAPPPVNPPVAQTPITRFDLPKEVESQKLPKKPPTSVKPNQKPAEKKIEAPQKPEPKKEEKPPETPQKKFIEARPIDLRSVVGLMCFFENEKGEKTRYRGSGIIIREGTYAKGTYILTNRHLIDLKWESEFPGGEGADKDKDLKDCEVRVFLGEGKILPEETYPYPYYDLKTMKGLHYDFRARLAYLPNTKNVSYDENGELDYAILEITEKNTSKYLDNENPRLPAAPILIPKLEDWANILQGNRVVMPGYAFQQEGGSSFDEFRLLAKDGILEEIYVGNKILENTPLAVAVEVPPDAYGGRSGSPMFYRGYLIGLVATKALPAPNSKNYKSTQPAINAIIENMKSQVANVNDIFEDIHYFK